MAKRYQIQTADNAWLHHAAEDVKASRMSWYAPTVTNPPRTHRRIAQYLEYTERVLDWLPPAPTVAERMAWYAPVSEPYFQRSMPLAVSIPSFIPSQPHYGGAFVGTLYIEPTYAASRIGAEPTYFGILDSQP